MSDLEILNVEMQKRLLCTLEINYGSDMDYGNCKNIFNRIIQGCEKHNLQYEILKKQRCWCSDYQIIKIKIQTSLYDVFKIIEDIDLSISVLIHKDGSIIGWYDNTH